jgi:protein involved in polysaccharide export with SLBB domain
VGPAPTPDFAGTAIQPRELDKVTLPVYRVEPPDILLIEAVNNIRPSSDKLRAGDELIVRVGNTLPIDPGGDPLLNEFKYISGSFLVQSSGEIDLGPQYGKVKVDGMTLDEATKAIEQHLKKDIQMPQVAVSLPNVAGKQQIAGEHLVRPDGTISLGVYGSVPVAGHTLDEVKRMVERHLSTFIHQPEVRVDVLAYNSKVYYVITDGGGFGERVVRLPCTGNETVLDAIANIEGLSEVSSKKIWIARPAPAGTMNSQVLSVDWRAIAAGGMTSTNYQVLPGDRIYIQADDMIKLDNWVAKITSPFERIFGFTLLGNGTVRALQQGSDAFGGGSNSGF